MVSVTKLTKLGEFGLIDLIRKEVGAGRRVVRGIGDDCAVLAYTKDKYQLFKTDMLIEDVHFTRRMPAHLIGRKALACNVSDIAAMGGVPTFAVVSLGLPKITPVKFVTEIYRGMNDLAKQFGVSIVGGDTNRADKIVINVALLGEAQKKCLVTRAGARPKDWIFVTGALGGSFKSGRHLAFVPRLEQAQFLVQNFKPSAMMDISDGLGGDLNHILKASRVGARLWPESIPRHKGVTLQQAMSDGEDFELLFTLAPAKAKQLMDWQMRRKNWQFSPIGEVTANPKDKINAQGFSHFQ